MAAKPTPNTPCPCPVCGDCGSREIWRIGDRLFATTNLEFSLHRCPSCQTDHLVPVPSDDELGGYYPEEYWVAPPTQARASLMLRSSEFYRRLVLRNHIQFVRRVIGEQRRRGLTPRIVDVGCGDGSYLEALGAEHSVGIDLSLPALRSGRARGQTTTRGTLFSKGRGTAPFADRSFSVITAFHFLEHVSDPRPILAEMHRLLRHDGDLVIQVPNKDSWQAKLLGARWSGLDVPRHLVNYSARTVSDVLEACGFDVIRQSHFSLRDGPMTLANSLVPVLYPPARRARLGDRDIGVGAWLARLAYLGVTLASLPVSLIESSFGHGAAVMLQARPRAK